MISLETEPRAAHASPIHSVDILAFVEAQEIPALYLATPYRLAPAPGGEKLYALLCEELRNSGKIGIAHVVLRGRQHLAVLAPQGQSLMLTTLRWESEADGAAAEPLQPVEELLHAASTAMAAPNAGSDLSDRIIDAARHEARPPGSPVLAEYAMRDRKTAGFAMEELDGLQDDDEFSDGWYLTTALRRPLHRPDGYAIRAKRTRSQRSFCQRSRRTRWQ